MAKPEWPKVLAADLDAYSRSLNVHAGPAIAVTIMIFVMVANDHVGIGLVHALGNA